MQEMSQLPGQVQARTFEFWQRLGPIRQVAIVAVAMLGVGLLALLVVWARPPAYTAAYTSLNDQQAGAVVAKLKELKVPYQVQDGGTILVPTDQVYDARLQVAAAGLPEGGGIGFEIFDQTSFGLTDFAQKINYQRALEGELSRTINHLDAVEQSRVHLVIPQPTLYTEQKKDATASVVLHLRPGQQLSGSQLRGVTQLVAGSVEGLKPENITIVDGKGNVLSQQLAGDLAGSSGGATSGDAQQAFEARLASNLQAMLDRVVGPHRTTVQVSAALDWDRIDSTSEIFAPDRQPSRIRSEREIIEAYSSGGRLGPFGIPGVDSNVPTYQALTPTPAATQTAEATGQQRRDTTINYEISRQTEHIVRAPGSIKRLSVAVVADSAVVTPEQVDDLRNVVSAAAGLSTDRGDVITVTRLPFEKSTPVPIDEPDRQQEIVLSQVRTGAAILGPLLLLLFLWLVLRRPRRRGLASSATPQMAAGRGTQLGALALAQTALRSLNPEDEQRERVRERIFALARDDPAMLAQLVRTWVEEEG